MSGFSFGSNLNQPAASAAGSGFTFGAPKTTAAPTLFGASSAPTTGGLGGFGATPAAATGGLGGFGATAGTATGGLGGFGIQPAAATGGFGAAPAAASGGLTGFGATPAATGLGGFGTPATGTTGGLGGFGAATAQGGLGGFGAAPAQAAPGGFGTTPAQGGITGFGATQAQGGLGGFGATPAQGSLGGFGATSAQGGLSGFGTTPVASVAPNMSSGGTGAFGFGLPTSSAPSAAPTFNFAAPTTAKSGAATLPTLSFGTQQAAPNTFGALGGATNFSFGKPATTLGGGASLNFGTTTTSVGTLGGGGLFGKVLPNLSATTNAAAPTFQGLGGVDVSATQPKAGSSTTDNVKVKEMPVPEEIAKDVESLRTYIKEQKSLSSDIGRASSSKLLSVSKEISALKVTLQGIANCVEDNDKQIKLLRKETSKVAQAVEMVQRTHDTPAGLQFENTAPMLFFQNLVQEYEQDLIKIRQQIVLTEKHMRSLTNPQSVSPADLKRGLQQMHESFISLAGRVHDLHQQVETLKTQYLNLRKYRLRDNTDIFAELDSSKPDETSRTVSSGPTPFSSLTPFNSLGKTFNTLNASASGAPGAAGQGGK